MAFLLKSLDIMMCDLSQILLYNVGVQYGLSS